MKSCCAVGCHARYSKGCGLQFHRFPKDAQRRGEWAAAVNRRNWEPTEYSWICSNHFVGGKKSDDPTSPAYVPTLFSHTNSPKKRTSEEDLQRFSRAKETKRRRLELLEMKRIISENEIKEAEEQERLEAEKERERLETERLEAEKEREKLEIERLEAEKERERLEAEKRRERLENYEELFIEFGQPEESSTASTSTMTEITSKDVSTDREVERYKRENAQLSQQLVSLKKSLITPESLMDNDIKVKYFTGLPSYKTLKVVFDFVAPCFKTYSRTTLPLFNQFLMVLARLRVNMDIDHLSYHFGIHSSNVSRTIRRWVNVLYERLGVLIKWPEREELYKTMPTAFKNFGKCVVIIDCFEVFMERPSSLKPRAQTWSNYKHHNTCKFLIGITPQGSISFVSQAWGGRVSDVHLTEQCGLLKNLIHGDLILADRGFTIQDSASYYLAEVKVPSFTKGKPQLSKYEVDTTRELAHVRIHVERVIGMLKQKFKILNSILPVSLLMCDPNSESEVSMIDKIVVVCAALCNCCDSVISSD